MIEHDTARKRSKLFLGPVKKAFHSGKCPTNRHTISTSNAMVNAISTFSESQRAGETF